MDTLLLNKSDVGSLIDLDAILEAVEDGYRSFNSGLVVQPDFMTIVKPGTHTGFDFKGGLDMGGGYITIKSSSGGYKRLKVYYGRDLDYRLPNGCRRSHIG